MRKIALIVLIITLIILSAIFLGNRASQDTILGKEIHSILEQEEKQMDLTTMTDFEWDAVEVFGPYSTNEIIEDSMDIRFKGDNGGIDVLEDRFLLVFANGKNAVKTVVLSRKYGNFTIKDNKILIVE
ncbi:hypothetical protein CSV72_16340 [Sporosarcina sp. P20a]|uniref:hypothetical protein n=1 Tax=unclassified Sporosarcina TaxID=2647733 RepID=UPI000C16E3F5|nr:MULTISPECIES: hypothetical protein [unclassified Sporosarcina]PIC84919.1 hypothetical protein CSV72_16340 [Sporosarcina sp. P20a]PID04515.1 hypothetical protein CSV66_14830 [Sporosarcina sp. P30]PID07861.1 hypothetical protein CSV65_13890 [Sporosarcina sp. P31]PID10828.1 hypothetical protein CSV64_14915 [Sporosarcina sp. P32b]